MDQSAFGQKVAQLRIRFATQAIGRVEELLTLLDKPSEAFAPEDRQRVLHRHYHDLAGSSAMLGFTELEAEIRAAGLPSQNADHQGRDVTAQEISAMRDATNALLEHARDIAEGTGA